MMLIRMDPLTIKNSVISSLEKLRLLKPKEVQVELEEAWNLFLKNFALSLNPEVRKELLDLADHSESWMITTQDH